MNKIIWLLALMVKHIMNIWPCSFLHPYPLWNWLVLKHQDLIAPNWRNKSGENK